MAAVHVCDDWMLALADSARALRESILEGRIPKLCWVLSKGHYHDVVRSGLSLKLCPSRKMIVGRFQDPHGLHFVQPSRNDNMGRFAMATVLALNFPTECGKLRGVKFRLV